MNIIKGYRTRKVYQRTTALRAVSLALYDAENGKADPQYAAVLAQIRAERGER
ncbi:hypothetical protein [Streptomyces platensis]|uniref:hypothetical protein n=1 Tax=Streptomyces platensis TaxID=58346 RepID=UPI001F2ADC81|nr:hypothetical protein [Streptomyces platensis]MCF3146511.1 hypothetical protein [Streptomyces platensis]